jgi:lysophospholipase L1-like esterase
MIKRFITSLTAALLLAVAALPVFSTTVHAQGNNSAPTTKYTALGDSVAAGLGLPPTGDQPAACGRSPQGYPYQVAQTTGLDLAHIACSGATAGDLFTAQDRQGTSVPAQIDQAFAGGKPQLITITAGANDLKWTEVFGKCYASTCGTPTDSATTAARRFAVRVKLAYALANIKFRSHGTPPKVVLTGYYNPLSAQCAALDPHFTAEEMTWVQGQVQSLNQAIQDVSNLFGFTSFAPVDFTGHDVCSASPWVQGQADPAPFHPNATGQAVISQAVLTKL